MRLRTLLAAGFVVSSILAANACSDNGGRTASSSSGDGGDTGSGGSSSSMGTSVGGSGEGGSGGKGQGGAGQGGAGTGGEGTGGVGTGGAGTGGAGTGGAGTGGAGTGGAGTGGAGTGGAGTGGSMPLVEICNNTTDDDGDGMTDCAHAAVCGKLVINEVDYEQPGTDSTEFIEIWNAGATDVDLSGVHLLLINGATSATYAPDTALSGTLTAGQYLVVASSNVMNIDPAAMVVQFPAATNQVQNGSPDGIALFDMTNNALLDSLSYEGPIPAAMINGMTYNLVAGSPTPAVDTGAVGFPVGSLIRYPNGQDTNDDSVDWIVTSKLTPGAANQNSPEICDNMTDEDGDSLIDCADPDCAAAPNCMVAEICDNTIDDDGDGMIDCADADCAAAPNCMVTEDCTNGLDDDGDGMTDCADPDCDLKACDALGSVCTLSVCSCPGGAVESVCDDNMDNNCDGFVDCADADCALNPTCLTSKVTAVDYQVITRGGKLVITGSGFTGSTVVMIGGVAQIFTVDSDTQITISLVDNATPLAAQQLVVTTPMGDTTPFNLTVIDLQINEIDSDTPGTDMAEFVEISAGVPGVSLAGYTLVFWNGSNDLAYYAANINATTDANGYVLLGNTLLVPAPQIVFADNFLQNGADAVGIYQTAAGNFVTMGAGATPVTASNLIDALVYDTADADDPGLLDTLLGPMGTPGRVQVDENPAMNSQTVSIQRCGAGRRDGTKFVVGAPTPGAVNGVASCP